MDKFESRQRSSIAGFYSGKSILVTGGTGFIGKVLLEKILRCCPGVQEIFVLIRPKKGVSIGERLKRITETPLFEKIRAERGEVLNKLIAVRGDATEEGLGLSPLDSQPIIERVSVIFHTAASVRFDDTLKDAIFINTRSTRDICALAKSMKNLAVLVHVSSTYTHIDKLEVEEKFYSFDVDWRKMIKIAETTDDETLRALTPKFLGSIPNTYIFSKRLAEEVIRENARGLPCVLFRPSVVVSTLNDPLEGWIDNFNGPVGLMVGSGTGLLRVVYVNPRTNCDYIPVDVTVKALLVAAWERGFKGVTEDPGIYVYNCAASGSRQLSTNQALAYGNLLVPEIPLEKALWSMSTVPVENSTLYYLMAMWLHIIPAILIDALLRLVGKHPMLLRLQRKVYVANISLSHFTMFQWKFRNANLVRAVRELPQDEHDFIVDADALNITNFFRNSIIGAKKYLLKEDMDQLEKAKIHYRRLQWLDRIVKICLGIACAYLMYARFGSFQQERWFI